MVTNDNPPIQREIHIIAIVSRLLDFFHIQKPANVQRGNNELRDIFPSYVTSNYNMQTIQFTHALAKPINTQFLPNEVHYEGFTK